MDGGIGLDHVRSRVGRGFEETRSGVGAMPPAGLVLVGIFCVQLGAALAKGLFEEAGAGGTVFMRVAFAAVILFAVGRHAAPSPLATWAAFAVLRILVAPVLALTFLVCAIFSPHRSPRLALIAATVMEVAVTACGGAVWFVPLFFPPS